MKEKVNENWEKIKSFFAEMGTKTKILLGVVLAVILIICFARWLVLQNKDYEVVFYDLNANDMQKITEYMLENNVLDYKIDVDNGNISVPEGTADPLRAAIYMLGIPDSGMAYQTYNSMVGSMSTDTDKVIASTYELQDRLAATIRNFNGVENASVTISEGENRVYVLDSSNLTKTTAFVYVDLKNNTTLSADVANAIRLGVAHGVSDLSPEDITIADNLGNTYTESGSSAVSSGEASYLKLELQQYVNNQIRTELMMSLGAVYDISNIRITVNSEVDIDRKYSTSTEYPMPEYGIDPENPDDGAGIINSQIWSGAVYGNDGVYIGGLVGTTPNSDIPTYPADTDGDGELDWQGYNSGQIDYAIPEVNTQKEEIAAVITDVQIGVVINSASENGESLSEEQVINYVSTSARISSELAEEKVSVLFGPFASYEVEEDDSIPTWVWLAVVAGVALFLIIVIIIILLVRKKRREEEEAALAAEEEERRLEAEQAAAEIAALAPVDGADIMDVNTEKSMELRKELRTFVGNNPEIAASLLRNLMKGGEQPDAT
ncbi:MAG: flagellar M-ring protein FliF C-terminal domain-containing protein [Eubacteriales bacterium]